MHQQGGIYFFTIILLERKNNSLLVTHITALRESALAID
jgi:hypothetical protein